eukprot:TRINITY_DN7231_c0_g1_i1.p1 TRINITY_DN7231_c0_g1~~TRINITY_DN7231_c0_g1_i1.p1  ORF type:complete len:331 (-),score=64.49 TRINITY_DN7231_c0_g1_i1:292-1284(-)
MDTSGVPPKKEIYEYCAPWLVYGMSWSFREDKPFRFVVGSFIEEYANKVEIVQQSPVSGEFERVVGFDHPYPTTKIMFLPSRSTSEKDMIATTGDYLRLWDVKEDSVEMKCCLNNNKSSEFCAPLTSFDWNEADPRIVGTASIDTTCTIWDVVTGQPRTQLIAHEKEVYDITFSKGPDVFATVGADGSVRTFDLRALDHSTVVFETNPAVPLLRVAWNRQDPNYLATIPLDSKKLYILDTRVPSLPVAELEGHAATINGVVWAPHSSCHVCTCGDDHQALIWDLSQMPKPIYDPILAYTAEGEVNQLAWSSLQPDWVSIAVGMKVQILRV